MTICGIEFVIGIPSVDGFEERVDRMYKSLSTNFALKSVDISSNEDKGTITVLLGVEVPAGIEPDPFVPEVAEDAIDAAIKASETATFSPGERIAPSSRTFAFA